jgi:hypothetical protein
MVVLEEFRSAILIANKLGPCGTWSVWQAVVMEVEVLEVASHLTPILLPCTLILEVCSGANDGPRGPVSPRFFSVDELIGNVRFLLNNIYSSLTSWRYQPIRLIFHQRNGGKYK